MIHPAYNKDPIPGKKVSDPNGGIIDPDSYLFGTILACFQDEYYYDPEFRIAGSHWMKIPDSECHTGWRWKGVSSAR